MSTFRVVLVPLVGLSAACADTVGPEVRAADSRGPRLAVVVPVPYDGDPVEPTPPGVPVYEIPTPEQIATLPAEYRTETGFLHTGTHAYFADGKAAATSSMQWRGNGGRQELTMVLRGRDETYERTFTSQGGAGGPWSQNALTTFGRIPMLSNCGNILAAYTRHMIWNQVIAPNQVGRDAIGVAWWRWGDKERGSDDDARQDACAGESPGGNKPVSNPGGGNMTCRTITTEHYWYYPDTGAYEYRYTTSRYECSPTASA